MRMQNSPMAPKFEPGELGAAGEAPPPAERQALDDLFSLTYEELRRLEPRQAMMVESRFFGGLDVTEAAALLGVSEATILRDWRAAKAWLAHELRQGR